MNEHDLLSSGLQQNFNIRRVSRSIRSKNRLYIFGNKQF